MLILIFLNTRNLIMKMNSPQNLTLAKMKNLKLCFLLLCPLILAACGPAEKQQESVAEERAKYEPEDGKVILFLGFLKSFFSPGIPVYRIMCMLKQIGTAFID